VGPASSPIIWNGMVIVQCDTQADSFLLALNAETGETIWKTDRQELPSWGTPTIVTTSAGPELVTNASNFVRGYDPKTGSELWKLGGSSKLTAPTPIFANGLHIVASGRAPERPMFAVKAGARGDLTLAKDVTETPAVAWSKTAAGHTCRRRCSIAGSFTCSPTTASSTRMRRRPGKEIYRQRLPLVGSGYSASPVAADGKIYLSNEDGEMLVVEAGASFKHIATNSIGEMLMATPALSDGVMSSRGFRPLCDRTTPWPAVALRKGLASLAEHLLEHRHRLLHVFHPASEMRAQVFSIGGKSRPTATPSSRQPSRKPAAGRPMFTKMKLVCESATW
jgi:outer membrane protein assembly factor BamB